MGDSATIDLKAQDKNLKPTLNKAEGSIRGFGSSVKKIFVVLMAALAIKKLFDFGKKLFALYAQQEKSEARLEAVVKATGGAAGFTAQQMKDMAAAMQEVTIHGDEVVMEAQAIIATFKNIRGEEFKRVTMLSSDLAEVLGGDLKSSSMQLAKALNDPIKGMTMLTRVGVTFSEEQKKMVASMVEAGDVAGAQNVIMDELAGQVGGASAAAAKTFSGRWTQMKNMLGDVGEKIFAALIPALEGIMPMIEGLGNVISNWVVPAISAMVKAVQWIAGAVWSVLKPAFDWWLEIAVERFTVFQMAIESLWSYLSEAFAAIGSIFEGFGGTVGGVFGTVIGWISDFINTTILVLIVSIENLRDIWTIVWTSVLLAFVKTWGQLKHFFTEVIPSVLVWLRENFRGIFTDIANIHKTIFGNMLKNAKGFWTALKGAMTGKGWSFKPVGLMEGFESAIKELPKIAAREKGPLEKELEDQLTGAADSLSGAYERKRKEFEDRAKANKEALAGAFEAGEGGPAMDDIKADEAALAAGYSVTQPKPDKDKKDKKDKDKDEFTASFEDLSSISKRIAAAAAGGAKSPEAKEAEKQGNRAIEAAIEIKKAVEVGSEFMGNVVTGVKKLIDDIPMIGALK
jgi:hypothetical protein